MRISKKKIVNTFLIEHLKELKFEFLVECVTKIFILFPTILTDAFLVKFPEGCTMELLDIHICRK